MALCGRLSALILMMSDSFEFSRVTSLALIREAQRRAVRHISCASIPTEVVEAIVRAATVVMTCVRILWRRANESHQNKTMNPMFLADIFLAKTNLEIAKFRQMGFSYRRLQLLWTASVVANYARFGAYPAESRGRVVALIARDGCPSLNFVVKHANNYMQGAT